MASRPISRETELLRIYLTTIKNILVKSKDKDPLNNIYSLKHPVLPRKSVAPDGIRTHTSHIPMECPNHQTTDTTFSLVPSSKDLCRTRTKVLDLDLLMTTTAVFCFALSMHLSSAHNTSVHLSSVQWRHLFPANCLSDVY